jgi:uncharacterized protein YukE
MADLSVQTEAIQDAADSFAGVSDDLKSTLDGMVAGLAIPADAFPVDVPEAARDYEKLRAEVGMLMPALQQLLGTIGAGLSAVAGNYVSCEQTNGRNFTYDSHGKPSAQPS